MPSTTHLSDCRQQMRRVMRLIDESRARLARSRKLLDESDGRLFETDLQTARRESDQGCGDWNRYLECHRRRAKYSRSPPPAVI